MPQVDTYDIIEKVLKSKESQREIVKKTLENIIIDSVDVFRGIDEYKTQFSQKDEVRAPDFYYQAQDVLSGYYMYLSPIVEVLTALRDIRENSYFHSVRVQFEKNPPRKKNDKGIEVPEKFVSSPVEKEAREHVSEEYYICAVFVGYLDACRNAIQTCRNRTKAYDDEFRASK